MKYVGLMILFFNKLPECGTLVPRHVGLVPNMTCVALLLYFNLCILLVKMWNVN